MPSIAPKIDRRGLNQKVAAALRRDAAEEAAHRYKRDLWALMTEIGKVNVVEGRLVTITDKQPCLSYEFHKPIIERRSAMRQLRKAGKGKDQLMLFGRFHLKTTIMEWETIQDYLIDPTDTVCWFHAVEERAQRSAVNIAKELQYNKDLRKLFPPGALPSELARKFIQQSGFVLPAGRMNRDHSFSAFGWTSEATGAHARRVKLDDVVSRNAVEDNQLPKLLSWYQNTVMPIVAGGWKDAAGTRWDLHDLYETLLKSEYWECIVRGTVEDENQKPDDAGKSVYMDEKWVKKVKSEMAMDWAPQMQNDPSPEGEKPWSLDCERSMPKKEAEGCPGTIVIITDPAPARIGSFEFGSGTNYRGLGGEKDEWATAVLKLRRVGDRREIILLYGDSSRAWDTDAGFERMAHMAYSYKARRYAIEKTGQAVVTYENEFQKARRKVGVSGCSEIELETTYKGKNPRFGLLCSRAKAGEFFVSEGCPKTFTDKFIEQARTWRPMGNKNGLREDGAADCVSYACDPGFSTAYVDVPVVRIPGPLDDEVKDTYRNRSRYCAV